MIKLEELRQILKAHAGKYPLMEPTDAVKLIYQNEFGAGHMIKDKASCMNYLLREYETVDKQHSADVYESIGNGLVRVNLCAVSKEGLEVLGQLFIHGAGVHHGSRERFLEKLNVLKALTAQSCFSFDSDALAQYLKQYLAAGCPAVSHSSAYRQQYSPAYRVIRYCDLVTVNTALIR